MNMNPRNLRLGHAASCLGQSEPNNQHAGSVFYRWSLALPV
jgi:hypothetical protein